jgi:hypothetical protein
MTRKPKIDEAAPYPRDMLGYGASPPHPQWPGGARIAVQVVLRAKNSRRPKKFEDTSRFPSPAASTII